MLISASFSSLLAIWLWHETEMREQALAPEQVQTVAGNLDACEKRGVDTPFGRLGCSTSAAKAGPVRQVRAGGALFISPQN